MSDFKVGDKVVIKSLDRSHMGRVHNGETVTIKEIKDMEWEGGVRIEHYAMFEEFHEDGVWLNELEPLQKVIVRKQIQVVEPGLQVQYMTNTKKDRVSIIINGNSVGRIPFERIDQLIVSLVALQEEV